MGLGLVGRGQLTDDACTLMQTLKKFEHRDERVRALSFYLAEEWSLPNLDMVRAMHPLSPIPPAPVCVLDRVRGDRWDCAKLVFRIPTDRAVVLGHWQSAPAM